jgi:hypothetical protein
MHDEGGKTAPLPPFAEREETVGLMEGADTY